ncbi:MAG: DUF3857 domain-containing protein [Flavobacterium sp.]
MSFNKLVMILLFLVSFSKINAQKFEPGKVSVADLLEKTHPSDSSASAAIVYKKARTFFVYNQRTGFTTVHEYEFRIKIYKKEGLNWADYQVPYYVGYENLSDEVVKFTSGMTYNLEDGVIIKTKLNSEGSFKKNVNEYWSQASITMPNVKVGSVIEFKYILKSENTVKFPAFNFQEEIPVNYSEYITEIPEFFIYKNVISGFTKVNSTEKLKNGFQVFQNENTHSINLSYQQINTIYIAENVRALKDENYVDNLQNYRSSIQHELQKTRLPGQFEKNYSETWDGVAQTILENKNFGKELNQEFYFEKDLKTVVNQEASETERANAVLNFVKLKMNWDNQKGYLTEKGVKQAYIDRTGNVAEINFILIAMLKYAGINANPVLVSTREHGISVFPNRTIFNYVIVEAEVDGKKILLDATNKNTTLNIVPLNVLNWTGRLIRQDGTSEEINLVPNTLSKEIINMMFTIDDMGKITGKSRIQKIDYEAFSFREKYAGINNEAYLEKLENNFNGIQIKDYVIENKNTNLSKPIIETFTFTSDNHCEIIGGKMFINPLLFFTQAKNPFVQEKRELPIYFGYPKQEKYNIIFEIPDGYTVESIPKTITISAIENIGLFTFNSIASENKIQIAITIDINAAIVSADYYEVLKGFFQKMVDKQNEKIVLKKV